MTDTLTHNDRFKNRRKLMTVRADAIEVAAQLRALLSPVHEGDLRALLDTLHPADLVDAMFFLSPAEDRLVFERLDAVEAAEVLDEADKDTEANLVAAITADKLANILGELPADEAADIVGNLPGGQVEAVLAHSGADDAREIRALLAYPPDSAGGIMSLGYVAVSVDATQEQALQGFRDNPEAEHIFYVFAVDAAGNLKGVVDLLLLLRASADTPLREIMTEDFLFVAPETDQEQVAHIFARYDLTALAVVEGTEKKLLGVVTADDIIDVMQEESDEDIAHMAGSDAQELENKSPVKVAMLRLPWIMTTLFIELMAGFVINGFKGTLEKFILLASFMPIISAISGNTGLQSAAIIIRGLSSGQVQLSHWKHALARQVTTTIILGGACAATLGLIGGFWDHHWAFGLVVFLGMFVSVNIAGVVGTVVPLLSKRAGFDPALTAGPFETAFQDVVGISIFLSLAATLLRWLR